MQRFSPVTLVALACAFGAILHALPQGKPDPAPDKGTVNVAGKWVMTPRDGYGHGNAGPRTQTGRSEDHGDVTRGDTGPSRWKVR